MNIAVLMTCHNRRETTLRCLGALRTAANEVKSKSERGTSADFSVFLVDDGSTDGTGVAVARLFDSSDCLRGRVIRGDGSLYWAKGMRVAWEMAVQVEKIEGPFDFYLWLNDDVILKEDAVLRILEDWRVCGDPRGVIAGACSSSALETECSYGATDAHNELIPPNGRVHRAWGWFTGNFVLIPRETVQVVGLISNEYTHARADFDYAERVKQAGIPFFVSSAYVGVCANDWKNKMRGLSLHSRLTSLWRPGYSNLHDLWLIRSRYHGKVRAIISCLHMIALVFRKVK